MKKHQDNLGLGKEKLKLDAQKNAEDLGIKKEELKIKKKVANKPPSSNSK